MSKSPTEYIRHILDEISFIEGELKDLTETQFMHDPVRQRAFARSLEIIGEAAKQVPDKTKTNHPEVDWRGLAGLRDKLIHHYFGVDYAIVWDVIINELPNAKRQLTLIVKK